MVDILQFLIGQEMCADFGQDLFCALARFQKISSAILVSDSNGSEKSPSRQRDWKTLQPALISAATRAAYEARLLPRIYEERNQILKKRRCNIMKTVAK